MSRHGTPPHPLVFYCRGCDDYIECAGVTCTRDCENQPACETRERCERCHPTPPCIACGAPEGEHDDGCPVAEEEREPDDDDGCDHACGECGRGIPSYQSDGSLCWQCEEEIAREETARSIEAEADARLVRAAGEDGASAICPACGVHVALGTCCPKCDVYFGDPCPDCDGIGYHARTCPALDRLGDEAAYR